MPVKNLDSFHWPLFFVTLAILAIGLVNLFSASFATRPGYFSAQLSWSGIAILIAAVVYAIDYRIYERTALIMFVATIALLAAVFFFRPVSGAHRWLILGPLSFQPSELMKIVLVLVMARYFHNHATPSQGWTLWRLRRLLTAFAAALLLILLEPDLGTTILLCAIAFTMLLFAKIHPRTLLIIFLAALIMIPVSWHFVLKPYQKQRIITLFDPDSDPRGSGYHRRQSIIAIGSGKLTGKGFKSGTQTQLRFLPEQHTDFIFSVWAEERGFLGASTLLMLYLAMILSGIHIASKAREKFGALAAIGATSIIFWHVVINVGMVVGLLPVVGVTLPLMSYGGSSLAVTLACIGLLLNIYARRRLF